MAQYMAVDQCGNTFHALTHPRKELMTLIGVKHASKMYVDGKDGGAHHIGYVIGGLWLTIYRIERIDQ